MKFNNVKTSPPDDMRIDNVKLSPTDLRDYQVSILGLELPEIFSLREYLHGREIQGPYSSCTANAIVAALEMYAAMAGEPVDYSKMHQYFFSRAMAGLEDRDGGAYPRDMCKVPAGLGVCLESSFPYTEANLNRMPPPAAILEGLRNNKWKYESIPINGVRYADRNTMIKEQIFQGFPVLIAMAVVEQFMRLKGPWQEHTWDYLAGPDNRFLGLHEVLAIGFDDRPHHKRLECANWWGPQWSDDGFFGLEYNPIESQMWQNYTIREIWVVKPE